jgi:uridine monophosphate synthetase
MEMCEKHQDFLVGVVCQSPDIVQNPGLLQLTPGISFDCQGDGQLGQQYCTPEDAVLSRGADIGVVGRGITKVEDPIMTAKKYRDRLWAAYEKRVGILKRGLVT